MIQRQMEKAARQKMQLTPEEALEEVVADSMESMLQSGNATQMLGKLSRQNMPLHRKVISFLADTTANLRSAVDAYSTLTPDTPEGKAVAQMADAVGKLENSYAHALADAADSYQTSGKNNAKSSAVKFQHQTNSVGYDYSKPFGDQLADYQSGLIPVRDTLVVGSTPDVLKKVGLAGLPMTINQKHINDALNGTYKGNQQEKLDHTFTMQELAKLPEKLADPIAVIQDKRVGKKDVSQSNIDVLVEMTVASGKQVLAAVQISGNGHINGLRIDTNKVATVHGNTDSISRLMEAINDHEKGDTSVYYVNNEKATKTIQSAGNPIPRGLNSLDGFIHNVTESGTPVNNRLANVTESLQFTRWFGDWKNQNGSKIVNSDGTPRVMQLESQVDISDGNIVNAQKEGEYGKGYYITDAARVKETQTGKQVYLNVRKPLQMGEETVNRTQTHNLLKNLAKGDNDSTAHVVSAIFGSNESMDAFQTLSTVSRLTNVGLSETTQKFNEVNSTDFDGIIADDRVVVFKPEQIKSVVSNIGLFGKDSKNINYSLRAEFAERQYNRWRQETEAAKRMYGDFDLSTELQNPEFRTMLQSGISVPDAYLVAHQGEIFLDAARTGVSIAEARANRRLEENRKRPTENGLSPGAAFITKPDVSKMTRADRLAIAHRVAKGERIVF